MKKEEKWEGTSIPSKFMIEAQTSIENEVYAHFTRDKLCDRLQVLEQRYMTFKEVLKKNKFARAYFCNGEPEFKNLGILFGGIVIKQEPSTTLIIISDSTDVVEGDKVDKSDASEEVNSPIVDQTLIIISDSTDKVDEVEANKGDKADGSEEVNSPMVDQALNLRRKLFRVDEPTKDLESTNDEGNYFYVVGAAGAKKCKLDNSYPPTSNKHVVKDNGSSRASSSASYSPIN